MLELLRKYGITTTNKWIKFPNISIIYMNQDANIYIDDSYIFYIDTTNDILYMSKKYAYKDMTTFKTSLSAYPIDCMLGFDNISGFISTSSF